jgi:CO/xanthine dehydrogenase Mo-binding subunit/aerobic-type carbon monoxide dehydrogenase small subunit (CoxS/CutS family)
MVMQNQYDVVQVEVSFVLNGQETQARVPGQMTLLRFLRDRLGLMGSKDGCSTGHCGACMVIVGGKATRACLVKMAKVDQARVETIEGLALDGNLHPIQRAFIQKGAVQCGFCTPGMIMTAKALLDANPHPTLGEIKKALTQNHNLCRCTGYIKIFEAIQLAAEWMAGGYPQPQGVPSRDLTAGKSLIDPIAVDMVTGKNVFGDDTVLDKMLYGKILWSAYPHARILSLDAREAEAMPGIVAVITAKDIPGKNQAGVVVRDQPAIAADRVRYIGDSLAAVFAESVEAAEAAMHKILVDYEVLPGVFSPDEAARPEAPKVHETGNLLHHAEIVRGDVDKAFEECAVVVENTYTTPFIEHAFLEPESGVAFLDDDGGVTLKIGTQTAFDDRTQLSEILAMPVEKIRVIQIPPGGAFGAKEDMIIQQYLALGALKTRRPVKIVLTREESLRVHVKRHPARMHFKTGVDRSGQVLAIEADITLDTGVYASLGIDVLENTVVFAAGPYYVPNLRIRGRSWYTNNVLAGAMRGFGVNQVAFALEQQMDAMARALGMDQFEFRLLNALDVGLPTAADHVLEEGVVSIKQTIQAARQAYRGISLPANNGKKIGVGVACAVKNIGFGHAIPEDAGAIVELDACGNVLVRASQHEYGQGARMGLLKLASHALGIPTERIEVLVPDTAVTPPTGPTTASRQTFLSGNAVVMACQALKEDLFGHAAEVLGVEPARLRFRDGQIVDIQSDRVMDLKELGERFVVSRRYVPPKTDGMLAVGETSRYGKSDFKSRVTHFCYAYNTQVAVVEADPHTGEVKVLKVVSANDVGKILNRQAIEGQIHGGVVMGLGYALSEQFVVENGINLTDSLYKCRIPTADQAPEITCVIVEVPHPFGPEGAKGFAEAPSLATAPAIVNAIYDALGVRVTSLPADKKKVLQALQDHTELNFLSKP